MPTTVHSMGESLANRLLSCVQPRALPHERSTSLRDLPRDTRQDLQIKMK